MKQDIKRSDLTIKDMILLKDSNDPVVRKYVTDELKSIFDRKPKSGDEKREEINKRRSRLSLHEIDSPMLKFLESATSSKLTLSEKQILKNLNTGRLPKSIMLLPMSGDEPRFRKWLWAAEGKFIENQNCYAYAMNQFRFFRHNKSIPGLKRHTLPNSEYTKCAPLVENILGDAGSESYVIKPHKSCKRGTYKIMLFVTSDKKKYSDFHFYRQDADGTFSHKQGHMFGPSKLDASGNIIFDPIKSDKNFTPYNYDEFCNAMCVPKEIKTNI